jgi:hypothetical protein
MFATLNTVSPPNHAFFVSVLTSVCVLPEFDDIDQHPDPWVGGASFHVTQPTERHKEAQ